MAGVHWKPDDREEVRAVSRRPFEPFFKAATGFQAGPHEYQANLAQYRRLPDILAVPTGCGKTAAAVVLEVHALGVAQVALDVPQPVGAAISPACHHAGVGGLALAGR